MSSTHGASQVSLLNIPLAPFPITLARSHPYSRTPLSFYATQYRGELPVFRSKKSRRAVHMRSHKPLYLIFLSLLFITHPSLPLNGIRSSVRFSRLRSVAYDMQSLRSRKPRDDQYKREFQTHLADASLPFSLPLHLTLTFVSLHSHSPLYLQETARQFDIFAAQKI